MTQFLGPTGTRLRRALPGATLFAVLLSLFVALPTYAVHDTGVFQLDGNAQQSVPASTAGDDWDNICASNPLTCTFATGFSASPSTTAVASAHVSDGALNATIFTGGGSKDPQDIPNWNYRTSVDA
jgi:hypothetical protein